MSLDALTEQAKNMRRSADHAESELNKQIANNNQSEINRLRAQISNLTDDLNNSNNDLTKSQREVIKYKNESLAYQDLLCKPMAEIAQVNGRFKETYEKQMELMADWMVSQKAFKELAIQFGFEKGQSAQETIQMGKEKNVNVIAGKNNPDHKTNADEFINKYASKIK